MKRGLKSNFWVALKYGISIFCLIYAFWGVPFAELGRTLRAYPLLPMLSVVGASFMAYAVMGLRLTRMASPRLSFRSTFCATLVGLAVNNVLPAKAGEIAKAVWMGRCNRLPFQKTLGIVFMERFFDVNVLALLSLWFLWSIGERKVVLVFVACLIMGWCVLVLFQARPAAAKRFTELFGRGRLRDFVAQLLSGILENMSPRRLAWLTVTSLAVWCFYGLQMGLGINRVAGLGLDGGVVLSVFAISGLSMLLPSSPGAIGVYEIFTVTVLKRYGVSQEEALAFALFAHMAQFIPVTLTGGLIFLAFPENAKNSAKV